jgi:DNA replication protein DnaC
MSTTPAEVLPAFRNIRVISDREAAERRAAEEQQAKRRTVEAARRHWNAPARHAEAKVQFEGPWAQKLAVIRSGLGRGSSFALCGTRGNGKTQLAVQAMFEATADGRTALYTTAVRFFATLKATYRKDAKETELEVIDRHRKPSLLVIDEIGKRGETAWEGNLLFELLNNRYADQTDTIVIANLNPQDLAESLGPSITSRLNETGGVIHCDWPSRR